MNLLKWFRQGNKQLRTLEYFIKRVESYNPSINAIIVKNYDEARKKHGN